MSEEEKSISTQPDSTAATSSYRSIFKATSLFGGVQVYRILIGIIQSKIIAVLLGTSGMGIYGMYQSAINFVQGITSLGLEQSAVRDVSEANNTNNSLRISRTVAILRKMVWFTGLIGTITVLITSPLLSRFTFGNYDYTLPFAFLSIILLLNQISVGQRVLLQGLRRLKDLAKSSALGATFGLIVSIPLYYWMGVKGIIPTMILNSLTALILSWLFARKVKIDNALVNIKEAVREGHVMIKMGIALTLNSILGLGIAYLIRWFIRYQGGLEEVGLFTAGFAIMNTYAGMVFNAMSTDYYPRLAAVNKNNQEGNRIINQQAEVATLIVAPLMALCIVFMPFVVRILYSEQFLEASEYIVWAAVGMLFKAASWSVSYNFIAKGEARLFIFNELFANFYGLALQLAGYYLLGLKGLGISFLLNFILYTLQVYIVSNRRYGFTFSRDYVLLFLPQLMLLTLSLGLFSMLQGLRCYLFGSILAITSMVLSYRGLNKRMNLSAIINSKLNKKI